MEDVPLGSLLEMSKKKNAKKLDAKTLPKIVAVSSSEDESDSEDDVIRRIRAKYNQYKNSKVDDDDDEEDDSNDDEAEDDDSDAKNNNNRNTRKSRTRKNDSDVKEQETGKKKKHDPEAEKRKQKELAKKNKKRDKNAPMELSAKMYVPKVQKVVQGRINKMSRDPRFDNLSGALHQSQFEASYSFLKEMRKEEMAQLKEKLSKMKKAGNANTEEFKEIQREYNRMLSLASEAKRANIAKKARKQIRQEEMELVAMGKKPYYFKKSDEKKLVNKLVYEELKKENPGKVKKLIAKKQKRVASKVKRYRPYDRKVGGDGE